MVACTMTLEDLNKLDGLPFDLIVHAGPGAADDLARCLRSGTDGLLAVMTDTNWLYRMLTEGDLADPGVFPVVVFGAPPESDLGARRFRMLQPDDRDLGLQLADVAVAYLRRESLQLLTPQFLLDGHPFP